MLNKKISKITYNFHQCGDNQNGIDEHFYTAEVGLNGVVEINELIPNNGLLRHCCVINYEDGKALKIFNLDTISYLNK